MADIPGALDNLEKTIYKAKQDLGEKKISQAKYGYARLTSKQYAYLSARPLEKHNPFRGGGVVAAALPQIKPLLP